MGKHRVLLTIAVVVSAAILWNRFGQRRCHEAGQGRPSRRCLRPTLLRHPVGDGATFMLIASTTLSFFRKPWLLVRATLTVAAFGAIAYAIFCLPTRWRAQLHRYVVDTMLRLLSLTPWSWLWWLISWMCWELKSFLSALYRAMPWTVMCFPVYLVAHVYYSYIMYPFIVTLHDWTVTVLAFTMFFFWRMWLQSDVWARLRAQYVPRLCAWTIREAMFVVGRIAVMCLGRRVIDTMRDLWRALRVGQARPFDMLETALRIFCRSRRRKSQRISQRRRLMRSGSLAGGG